MSTAPAHPKLYHITHVDNLASIVRAGALLSDAYMLQRGGPATGIGLSHIKRRRVEELAVPCHPGTRVGDYVPFYFCPRSLMLFVIHKGNHPDLTYHGGQTEIVHLEADLHEVVAWADSHDVRWAFSLANAGAYYAEFRTGLNELPALDWEAIEATDFRDPHVKEGKQAEFLVHQSFPWELVRRLGVHTPSMANRVERAVRAALHKPEIAVQPAWYY